MINPPPASKFEVVSEIFGEKVGKIVLTMTVGFARFVIRSIFDFYFGMGKFKRGFKKGFKF